MVFVRTREKIMGNLMICSYNWEMGYLILTKYFFEQDKLIFVHTWGQGFVHTMGHVFVHTWEASLVFIH